MTDKSINNPAATVTSESPCISVCTITEDKMCVGCFRSLDEIGRWTAMSETEKIAVNVKAVERKRVAESDLNRARSIPDQ